MQLLGVFVDDVKITATGGSTLVNTSFEDGTLAPFTVGDPPEGSKHIFKNWIASKSLGFEDGPGIRTSRSLLLGFGTEGVNGAANRSKLLKDGLRMLGVR